jgi:hypothetical protein
MKVSSRSHQGPIKVSSRSHQGLIKGRDFFGERAFALRTFFLKILFLIIYGKLDAMAKIIDPIIRNQLMLMAV